MAARGLRMRCSVVRCWLRESCAAKAKGHGFGPKVQQSSRFDFLGLQEVQSVSVKPFPTAYLCMVEIGHFLVCYVLFDFFGQ
jgi:hypothetical protein